MDITPHQLKQKLDNKEQFILLDVRTEEERKIAYIDKSKWIPIDELEQRFTEIYKNDEIIVYCHHGTRSEIAAAFLKEKGYNAASLKGGIDSWSKEVDTAVSQY